MTSAMNRPAAYKRRPRAEVSATDKLAAMSMPEPNSGCVLWLGAVARGGYGKLRVRNRVLAAHRVAYELAKGAVPLGYFVCHRCDVPACINSDHLFVGTAADNTHDAMAKGRARTAGLRVSKHRPVKLTAESVHAIRSDVRSQRAIASAFGLSKGTVSQIKHREIWRHLGDPK